MHSLRGPNKRVRPVREKQLVRPGPGLVLPLKLRIEGPQLMDNGERTNQ